MLICQITFYSEGTFVIFPYLQNNQNLAKPQLIDAGAEPTTPTLAKDVF